MATVSPEAQALGRHAWLTSPQRFWLIWQATALFGVWLWHFLSSWERMQIFFGEPAGVRLAAWTLGMIVLNFGLLLGGWYALDRLATSVPASAGLVRKLLNMVLCAACIVFLYIPAFFAMLLGPVVVGIQSTMLAS